MILGEHSDKSTILYTPGILKLIKVYRQIIAATIITG